MPEAPWERLTPLIPPRKNPHPLGGWRPRRADRDCADAIFFVSRTRCQRDALSVDGSMPRHRPGLVGKNFPPTTQCSTAPAAE